MNVLVIKFGALGDIVMATPLIAAIQAAHKPAAVDLLTTPAFAPIFDSWSDLGVRAVKRSGWSSMLVMLRNIRAGRYARIYDLQGNDRSGLLCALSGVRDRVGNHPRFPYNLHPTDKWHGQCHIFERMKQVLASAGVAVNDTVPLLPIAGDEQQAVDRWIEDSGLDDRRFAVMHAGASATRPEKCWPRYAALAARLVEHGVTPVWIGGEGERAQNAALQTTGGGIDASSRFSVAALAYFGRRAAFAVTNDSGPMHILSASGIAVFALFGPSNWRRNHALGQSDNVITPQNGSANIDEITVEQVIRRLETAACLDQ